MSTSTTTNLQLVKENADEPILRNHRQHTNSNLDTLDTAIKAVQDATATLEKARLNLVNLIGNIGKDANNADLISKAQARATLDVAQSNGAANTLYAAEQAIATNASAISSLRDSVSSYMGKNTARTISLENQHYVTVESPDAAHHYGVMLVATQAGAFAWIRAGETTVQVVNLLNNTDYSINLVGTPTKTKFKLDGRTQWAHWIILVGGSLAMADITGRNS